MFHLSTYMYFFCTKHTWNEGTEFSRELFETSNVFAVPEFIHNISVLQEIHSFFFECHLVFEAQFANGLWLPLSKHSVWNDWKPVAGWRGAQ